MNRIDLVGRCAVVTGGAQGIGRGVVERFLDSGASVSVWDRNQDLTEAAAKELSGRDLVRGLVVDVTNAEAIADAAARTVTDLGGIDILVNSAGITGPNSKCWDYPIEAWRHVIDVNLTGTFLCCRVVAPYMIKQKYGRIVNIASIAGKEGNPNASAYSASKAGVIALTKSIGKELATFDIAVNCVTPAAARTAIFDQMTESHISYMLSKIPRERFVEVGEIASMIAWLVSAENSFSTGAVFDISGGRATY
jgi:NAD(P)-dependent dehydrogenase (short-subunit alcohol dehydrogenase family)